MYKYMMYDVDREAGYKVALPQIVEVTDRSLGMANKFVFFVGERKVKVIYVYYKTAWRWWTRMKRRGYKISSNFNKDWAYGYIAYPKTPDPPREEISKDFLDF